MIRFSKRTVCRPGASKMKKKRKFWASFVAKMKKAKALLFEHYKKVWHIVLLAASTWFVWLHRSDLYSLDPLNAVSLIFLFWLLLLVYPLFSEMGFLGLSFKKEVAKVKEEVKKTAEELKTQIQNIQLSNSVTNHIEITYPMPTAVEMKALEESVVRKQTLSTRQAPEAPTNASYLFTIRYAMERRLVSLCTKAYYDGAWTIPLMLRYLAQRQTIEMTTVEMVTQIDRIANRGIHGEDINETYMNFVKAVAPAALDALDDALHRLP